MAIWHNLEMKKPRISIIAAVGKNRELGKENKLIWRVSADLRRVKELTTGHPIIMGRKTYESIGRPLPNRTNIIITRDQEYKADGCVIVTSFEDAIEEAGAIENEEMFVFGGAEIYKIALSHTDRLYLTKINATDSEADSFFPEYSEFTKIIDSETGVQDELTYEWLTLER